MPTEGNKNIQDAVLSVNRDAKERVVSERAAKINLPYLDIRTIELHPDALSLISKEEAVRGIVPVSTKGGKLTVGVADPNKKEVKEILEYLGKFYALNLNLISWDAVKDALPHYQGLKKQVLEQAPDYEISATEKATTFKELAIQINSAPVQDILKFIVRMAIDSNSSDIHFEPEKEGARIRFRIDGVLHVVGKLTNERYKYVLSQIELASGMKLNVDESQEGRLEVKVGAKTISVRVETMPTLYGDDISLRIFNTEATMLSLDDLGLSAYHSVSINKAISRPQGMILVVGPTGAGKTSTIYAILNVLNKTEVKIVTLEDPIEYALPGIAQSQIHEDESFYERLKAVLREDPDIIMVGEIRDAETADVAIHAALTGHVMISTFHANNAATAIGLLREISGGNNLLAPAINLIIAQRLVRRLCDKCKAKYEPSGTEKEFIDKVWAEIPAGIKEKIKPEYYKPVGCEVCGGLGFKGRLGIFEMLDLNLELQKVIARPEVTAAEIHESAKKFGMITMEEDGLLKAAAGTTALSEVIKAIKE